MISEFLNKDNLHHAYLLEGARENILEELFEFLKEAGIKISGNPDFQHIHTDTFRMEDARTLKSYEREKSFSAGKKIFVITTNSILLEAQGSLLKIFEEPTPHTHFFVIVPDANMLLKTLRSRFYVIRKENELVLAQAERFLMMRLTERIEFIKELITEEDEETTVDSARTKALHFLNSLELAFHRQALGNYEPRNLGHFFKVRQYLRMPGSSIKNLMESVALTIPVIQ